MVDQCRRSNAQLSSTSMEAAEMSLDLSQTPYILGRGGFDNRPTPFPMLDTSLGPTPVLTHISPVSTNMSYARPPSWVQVCAVLCRNGSDDMTFQCRSSACERKSYRRWADFMRHYNGHHATVRRIFWCPNSECTRSQGYGHMPFDRRDKRNDHVERAHRNST